MEHKYKVGRWVVNLEDPRYTFKVIEILPRQYKYELYYDNILTDYRYYNLIGFEEEVRPISKLEKALK